MTTATAAQRPIHQLLASAERAFNRAGIPAARREAETLLAALLQCWPLEVYLADALTPEQAGQFDAWVARRQEGVPAQHLTGTVHFCGHDFLVTPDTLIPRPETELVVEAALVRARSLGERALRLADVGTGCGNLAVSLTQALPSARMVAVDRSWAALMIARRNAARLGVAGRIQWVQGDGLTGTTPAFAPHIIVANPPYIPSRDLSRLPADVRCEPAMALDGGADGCRWHRRWLGEAAERLAPGGWAIFEIGDGQAERVQTIMQAARRLRLIEMQPDWQGIPRVLIAERV